MSTNVTTKIISISVPKSLLREIERAASELYMTRSKFFTWLAERDAVKNGYDYKKARTIQPQPSAIPREPRSQQQREILRTQKELMPGQDLVEWARAKQISIQFGIGRSTLYQLANEGRVESKLIKRANASKGTRLFSVRSIRDLLAASL